MPSPGGTYCYYRDERNLLCEIGSLDCSLCKIVLCRLLGFILRIEVHSPLDAIFGLTLGVVILMMNNYTALNN